MNKTVVSIIIVYYNEYNNFQKLLRSIKKDKPKTAYEIIVVDNSKENLQGKIKRLDKKIIYIKSSGNIGYAGGNNLGAVRARGKYLFVVNPDIVLMPGVLDVLSKFMDDNSDAAVAGPDFYFPNGRKIEYNGSKILTPIRAIFSMSFISKFWPNNPVNTDYLLKMFPLNKIRRVKVVSGSALMIRKKAFDEVSGFDPNFFLYFEENDLCKRLVESGENIYIVPKAKVTHDWKPSGDDNSLKNYFKESRYYYFRKHYGIVKAFFVELFTRIGRPKIFMKNIKNEAKTV